MSITINFHYVVVNRGLVAQISWRVEEVEQLDRCWLGEASGNFSLLLTSFFFFFLSFWSIFQTFQLFFSFSLSLLLCLPSGLFEANLLPARSPLALLSRFCFQTRSTRSSFAMHHHHHHYKHSTFQAYIHQLITVSPWTYLVGALWPILLDAHTKLFSPLQHTAHWGLPSFLTRRRISNAKGHILKSAKLKHKTLICKSVFNSSAVVILPPQKIPFFFLFAKES